MTMNSALKLAAMTLAATLSVPAAQAQSIDSTIHVDIPFAYTVGGKVLPAGSYAVYPNIGRGFLTLRKQDDPKVSMMVASNSAITNHPKQVSMLVFNRYNDKYFLNQVWAGGADRGVQLVPSKAE